MLYYVQKQKKETNERIISNMLNKINYPIFIDHNNKYLQVLFFYSNLSNYNKNFQIDTTQTIKEGDNKVI